MTRYAMLVHPSANRVYGQVAPSLTIAEVCALSDLALNRRVTDIEVRSIAGIPYVSFCADGPSDLAVVANVSSLYALFEMVGDDALRPVEADSLAAWDDDLVTIQRYVGKTNEQFTRLLLNITAAAARGAAAFVPSSPRLRVLDPMCGRGTTLNVAVRQGYDAAGVDIDGRDIDAYATFFGTWLKDHRIRHQTDRSQFRREGRVAGRTFSWSFAADKDALRTGLGQRVVVVADDSRHVVEHFGRSSVDVVVADLPYGVQHGAHRPGRIERQPGQLLQEALPAWRSVLRPSGAIGVSFNVRTLARDDAVAALSAAGFEVLAMPGFEHRVDQAIVRDAVVARH